LFVVSNQVAKVAVVRAATAAGVGAATRAGVHHKHASVEVEPQLNVVHVTGAVAGDSHVRWINRNDWCRPVLNGDGCNISDNVAAVVRARKRDGCLPSA